MLSVIGRISEFGEINVSIGINEEKKLVLLDTKRFISAAQPILKNQQVV